MSDKNFSSEQDVDVKSEAEDVDVVNSPQSSMTSEDNDPTRVIVDAGATQVFSYLRNQCKEVVFFTFKFCNCFPNFCKNACIVEV